MGLSSEILQNVTQPFTIQLYCSISDFYKEMLTLIGTIRFKRISDSGEEALQELNELHIFQ